jgi:ketosteroid isomerase-like protein
MNSDKTALVKQFLETAISGDWEKLNSFCHEKFQVRESSALPYEGIYKGVDGFRKLVKLIFVELFDDFVVEPQYFLEGENHVLLLANISGRGKKTGISFSSQVAEVYHFEDKLIKEIQPFYWDTKLINKVLGT